MSGEAGALACGVQKRRAAETACPNQLPTRSVLRGGTDQGGRPYGSCRGWRTVCFHRLRTLARFSGHLILALLVRSRDEIEESRPGGGALDFMTSLQSK